MEIDLNGFSLNTAELFLLGVGLAASALAALRLFRDRARSAAAKYAGIAATFFAAVAADFT